MIGIDMFRISRVPDDPDFYKRWLTEKEYKSVVSSVNPKARFAEIFAIKEAIVKASGGKINISEADSEDTRFETDSDSKGEYAVAIAREH